MPKFRYSLDGGSSWTVIDDSLPYSIPSNMGHTVTVEPIGDAVTEAGVGLSQTYRVGIFGESTTKGFGGGTPAPLTDYGVSAMSRMLQEGIVEAGYPAVSEGYAGGILGTPSYDSVRIISAAGAFTYAANNTAGGGLYYSANPAAVIEEILFGVEQIAVWTGTSTSGFGDFAYSVEPAAGGAAVASGTISGSSGTANSLRETVLDMPSRGNWRVRLNPAAAVTSYYFLTEGRNPSRNEIQIFNFGVAGAQTSSLIDSGSPRPWFNRYACASFRLDALYYEYGINDIVQNISTAAFNSNTRDFLTKARDDIPGIPIIIDLPNAFSGSGSAMTVAEMRSTLTAIATDYGATLLDRWAILGATFAEANASGYMYDSAHPKYVGYQALKASRTAALIEALGI